MPWICRSRNQVLRCAALLHDIKIGGDDYGHASVLNPNVEGTAVDPGLGDGPAGDRVGDPTSRRPAAGGQNLGIQSSARQGSPLQGQIMSCCSPRNVIVAQVERVPFAAHCERLPIGREYRLVATHQLRSGVTLRDLIERKEEGS